MVELAGVSGRKATKTSCLAIMPYQRSICSVTLFCHSDLDHQVLLSVRVPRCKLFSPPLFIPHSLRRIYYIELHCTNTGCLELFVWVRLFSLIYLVIPVSIHALGYSPALAFPSVLMPFIVNRNYEVISITLHLLIAFFLSLEELHHSTNFSDRWARSQLSCHYQFKKTIHFYLDTLE